MEAGQTIAGKYRLNRLLGTGGMATVWSATNVFTEREFAMKFMLPQVARTPEAARRFLLEAKVSARINHPNIIEVIDVGQAEDGSLFLVMELLTGVSLDVAVRRQRPSMLVHEFIHVMRDVAEALAAAHKSGVIHRDLKPTNVFLHKDRDGRVVPKILDFGVSKILEGETNTSLTVVGTVLGSPLYMSPEQAMGAEGIDGRTDVFAFGAMLFEALSGQRAFDAPNFNALIVTIATTQPKRIDDVAPQLPEQLRALIAECMVTDKKKRLDSFDRIVERFNQVMPELEQSDLRLPAQYQSERSIDPEETEALPLRRSSNRPPPSGSGPQPAGLAALVSMQQTTSPVADAGGHPSHHPPRSLALAAGVVAIFALIMGFAVAFARGGGFWPGAADRSAASPGTDTAQATKTATPAFTATESSSVPVISVDSLPLATRGSSTPRGNARLSIVASPGWCSVSVDGIPRGVTPLASFELSAGVHKVDCVPPSGKPKSASITVADGGAARYNFTIQE
jgi:serine/threonine-protein kinase